MYRSMLKQVRIRLKEIDDVALVIDAYNTEWLILKEIENDLIKLTKLREDME